MTDISRRDFLNEAGGTAAGVALASGLAQAQDSSRKRPRNILFLMTDQHRPFAMGHVGDGNAKTPTLDSLAASGMSFHRTYCQVPVCTPSRTSILSGRYMHSHGVLQNGYMPRKELVTFPQTLRQNGYKTGCFGKLHVNNRDELDWDELDQGKIVRKAEFPDMLGGTIRGDLPLGQPAPFPLERHKEWQAKENTIRFMRENRDEPWMIQCSMNKPHPAFQPPKEFWDQVDRDQLEVPSYPEDDLEDVNPEHLARMQQRKLENLTEDQVRDGMQGYYGNLAFCDAMFAEVVAELDRLGLRDETLIVYASDHGEMLYDHRLWTKFTFFEQSVHVPLIFSCPGLVPQSEISQSLVELIDLFPTFMDVLGLETPDSVQGMSLMPVLSGERDQHRDVVHSEFHFGRSRVTMRMHFDGRFKFIDNGTETIPELYDLEVDPREITNLAQVDEQGARVAQLTAELREWSQQDVVQGLRRRRRQE